MDKLINKFNDLSIPIGLGKDTLERIVKNNRQFYDLMYETIPPDASFEEVIELWEYFGFTGLEPRWTLDRRLYWTHYKDKILVYSSAFSCERACHLFQTRIPSTPELRLVAGLTVMTGLIDVAVHTDIAWESVESLYPALYHMCNKYAGIDCPQLVDYVTEAIVIGEDPPDTLGTPIEVCVDGKVYARLWVDTESVYVETVCAGELIHLQFKYKPDGLTSDMYTELLDIITFMNDVSSKFNWKMYILRFVVAALAMSGVEIMWSSTSLLDKGLSQLAPMNQPDVLQINSLNELSRNFYDYTGAMLFIY